MLDAQGARTRFGEADGAVVIEYVRCAPLSPVSMVLLVFALEQLAVERFEALIRQFQCRLSHNDDPSDVRTELPCTEPRIVVIIRRFALWLDEIRNNPGPYAVIYLRPSLVACIDLLAAPLASFVDIELSRHRALSSLDRILAQQHVLLVEDLFLDAPQASNKITDCFARAMGSSFPSIPHTVVGLASDYRDCARNILTSLTSKSHVDLCWASLLAVEQVHSITDTGLGSMALAHGWSQPEQTFVWSENESASLFLPIPRTGGPFRCELRGFVVSGDFITNAYVAGSRVGSFRTLESDPREIVYDVPLTLCESHPTDIVHLNLEFSGTVCPFQAGISNDMRILGLGLKSFRIYAARPDSMRIHPNETSAETLRSAGYSILVRDDARAKESPSVETEAWLVKRDSLSYRTCVLVLPPDQTELSEPIRWFQDQDCQLLLIVGGAYVAGSKHAIREEYPWIAFLSPDFEGGIDILSRLRLVPDTIVVWAAPKCDTTIKVIADRILGAQLPNTDILLISDDVGVLEPLQSAVQHYAAVIIVEPGAIAVRAKTRYLRYAVT